MILGHTAMNGRAQLSNPRLVGSHANRHSCELTGTCNHHCHWFTFATSTCRQRVISTEEKLHIHTYRTMPFYSTPTDKCLRPITIVGHWEIFQKDTYGLSVGSSGDLEIKEEGIK